MLRSNQNNAAEEGAFDAPLVEIEKRLQELEAFPPTRQSDQEIARLRARLSTLREDIYARLTPWQKTLVARHPRRPYTLDYARFLFEDFLEIHGDRRFADDPAIITGWASFHGRAAGPE